MKLSHPFGSRLFFLTLFVTLSLTAINAQNTRPASFDKQTKVAQIDESLPFGFQYDIDVSQLNLGDETQLNKYFSELETEDVKYVISSKNEVKIQLNLRAHPDWTVADWNKYLASQEKK